MLSTRIGYSRSPQVSSDTHGVGRTESLLAGAGEGVVVEEPSAVHDAPHPHPAAQVADQVRYAVQVDKDSGASCTAAHQVQFSTYRCVMFYKI